MKTARSLIFDFVAFAITTCSTAVQASDFRYTHKSDRIAVTSGTGSGEDVTTSGAIAGRPVEPLPIQHFCRSPSLTHLQLSPDGKRMTALTSEEGKQYLIVSDLVNGQIKRTMVPPFVSYGWVTEQRLLCYSGGVRLGEIFAVNIDGSELNILQESFWNQARRRGEIHFYGVLKILQKSSDEILVEDALFTPWNFGSHPRPDVQRLNFLNGKMHLVEKNPGKVVEWLSDNEGQVRAAITWDKDIVQLLYRASPKEPWAVLYSSTRDEADLAPAGFAGDGQLYVYSRHDSDVFFLYSFDPVSRQLGGCLSSEENAEIGKTAFSATGTPLGAFYESDRLKFKPLNETYRKLQAQMDASLPGTVNVPISTSRHGDKIVYAAYSDKDPGAYYLVDTVKNEFGIVGRSALWVKPERMATMQPIQYTARDGLTIQGYLTLPPGVAATNLPLIVMPHGDPASRDSWRYYPEAQFLANRGYAVLQPNFRGSRGYGLKFLRAGFKEWGGKMQDDITDAVHWAIEKGIADRQRIAMFGTSYGGYAALMGLITTPELFKCAICYACVTDVRSITRKSRLRGEVRADFEHIAREQIGDYRADKLQLQEISPVKLADKIQAPILLAYGALDPLSILIKPAPSPKRSKRTTSLSS